MPQAQTGRIFCNLPFAEWTEVLGSERLTDALLDRLTSSRPHPGDERRQLPPQTEPPKTNTILRTLNPTSPNAPREKDRFRYAPASFLPAISDQFNTHLLAYFCSGTMAGFYSAHDRKYLGKS